MTRAQHGESILAGDVGGTKTELALFARSGDGLREFRARVYPSREYRSLEAIVRAFLEAEPGGSVAAGCFGVAGPVRGGKARITNLPWELEEEALARTMGVPRVRLLNDLQAAAYGMLRLPPESFHTLHPGSGGTPGNAAVIAPGTGLGEAILHWDGRRYQAIASEGGHADFAARNEQEIELLRWLQARVGGHVSYERVLSGEGIHHLYLFLRDSGHVPEPAWLREKLAQGDPNAAITEVGLAGGHPLCVAALESFCSILGAEAGNLALRCTAVAGVFVGGGIPPKILPALTKGSFVRAFVDKGRFAQWTDAVPVRVALDPRAPLLGAAHFLLEDAG
ncbi:MAG TPA: glucokinase [Verrucomicrobiae bacterium]|nr:glucokinase [Verrucomicrobiae bacterium]